MSGHQIGIVLLILLGSTPAQAAPDLLQSTARRDRQAVIQALAAGADANTIDNSGRSALHIAADSGDTEIVELLLGAGANVNAAEFDGDTPLIGAAIRGHGSVVARLLEAGADPSVESSRGMTAADHARRKGHAALAMKIDRAARDRPSPPTITGLPPSPGLPQEILEMKRKTYRPGYARRVAAVIGINDYREWPRLGGAVSDAKRTAAALRQLGFDTVFELYDRDATRSGILDLLSQTLPEAVGEEDLALIFFAGHGDTETLPNGEKRGYIIPADGSTDRVFATAISMNELRDVARRVPAKHMYYVMDSCYSGLLLTRGLGLQPSTPGYVDKVTSRRAVQIIAAGMEGEEAIEREGRGLFTTAFLDALSGKADANHDGFVTAGEIGVYVAPEVTSMSSARQTPQFGALEGEGEVVFAVR